MPTTYAAEKQSPDWLREMVQQSYARDDAERLGTQWVNLAEGREVHTLFMIWDEYVKGWPMTGFRMPHAVERTPISGILGTVDAGNNPFSLGPSRSSQEIICDSGALWKDAAPERKSFMRRLAQAKDQLRSAQRLRVKVQPILLVDAGTSVTRKREIQYCLLHAVEADGKTFSL